MKAKGSAKMQEKAAEDRRVAMKKIEPLFPAEEHVNIRPKVKNGQTYFQLEIGHHTHVESRDVEDCVRKAKQIAHTKAGTTPPPKGKKVVTPKQDAKDKKPSTAFADYIKLVKKINHEMKQECAGLDITPDGLAKKIHKMFGVDIPVVYLQKAPNAGVMMMRACNRIAAETRRKARTPKIDLTGKGKV